MTHDDVMSVYLYNMIAAADPEAGVIYDDLTVSSTMQGKVLSEDFQNFDGPAKGWAIAASTAKSVSAYTQETLQSITAKLADAQDRVTQYVYDAAGHQIRNRTGPSSVYDQTAAASNGTVGTSQVFETSKDLNVEVTYDALGNAVVNRDTAGNYTFKVLVKIRSSTFNH